MFQHGAEIFWGENAPMFPHLQKHSQVNSFKTESKERWTARDNLHQLMTAPYKNVLFCLQFNCPHKHRERCLYFTVEAQLELLRNISMKKYFSFNGRTILVYICTFLLC